jgi:hypothetical protein
MEQFPARTSRSEGVQRRAFSEGAEGFSPLNKRRRKTGLQARAFVSLFQKANLFQSKKKAPKRAENARKSFVS